MGPDAQKCARMHKNAPRLGVPPVLSWGPWGPQKAQKTVHGGKGAPPWAWALWSYGPYVGPIGALLVLMWALLGPGSLAADFWLGTLGLGPFARDLWSRT